jgi:hypothetical protein
MPGGASALLKLEGKVTFLPWVWITITLVCIQTQRICLTIFISKFRALASGTI